MSEIGDAEEFATLSDNYDDSHDQKVHRGAVPSPYKESKAIDTDEYKKPTPGQPTQYALYGAGYTATTPTIPILPSGCYDISYDSNRTFVVPTPKPTGLLLELPEMRSDDVIRLIENFWNSEKDYKEGNEFVVGGAAFKAGIMLYGPPGCHAKGQGILMYDGTIKKVEDIVVSDKLMGPDSNPRTVLELKRGREEMVRITPVKGDPFVVNKSHILHLTPSHKNEIVRCPINMSVSDLLFNTSECFKERYKLTRTGVDFHEKELPIDPYFLGVWLGDGTSRVTDVTTMDSEIKTYLETYAQKMGMQCKERGSIGKGLAKTYGLTNGIGQKNPLYTFMKDLDLIENKHIPMMYKTASRMQRLELLAGLIDSDGHLNGSYDFTLKSEVLVNDLLYLARSLGFSAYKKECQKGCQNGFVGNYFRVSISGDLNVVPCKLIRKQAALRQQIKSVLRTGFTFEELPTDNFYGFTLNGDHLYLTDDFTIHHNSGKSCTIKIVSNKMVERGGTVFYASTSPSVVMDFLGDFAKIENNRKCIVILEDIDSLISNYGESSYLEMLDSAKTIDNVLFIATTNYPDKLDPRIYNRPGRFSHVVKVGLPGPKAREAFLRAILKNHRDVEEIVEKSSGFSVDHLSAVVNSVYREKKPLGQELERLRALFKIPKCEEAAKIGF